MQARSPDETERRRKAEAAGLLQDARQQLLIRAPFLGALVMRLTLRAVVDDRLETAMTDGQSLYAHADFIRGLPSEERLFVLAHEVWHCALRHFARRMDREPRRWNLAVDQEVNDLLLRQGLPLPAGAFYERRFRGEGAEAIYQRLPAQGGDRHRGRLADHHEGLPPGTGAGVQDPELAPQWPSDTAQRWAVWTQAALQQSSAAAGTLPGWLREHVEATGASRMPWQRYLARFVQHTRTGGGVQWVPPARRHWGRGLYLPSRRGTQLELTVVLDTSGSTRRHWPLFRRELHGIINAYDAYRLRVLQCDTRVVSDAVYTPEQPLPPACPFEGGGGTDLRAPFEYLSGERPTGVVLFTDGQARMPEKAPAYPVLWMLTPATQREPPWGQVVQMREAEA